MSKTPNLFILTLTLNVLYATALPLILLFAPMIVMVKNYQGATIVTDQAQRLQTKTSQYFHLNIARVVVLIGFSLLGALCGVVCATFGGVIGIFYQLIKVASIFFKVIFCCETKLERRHIRPISPAPASFDSDNSAGLSESSGVRFAVGPRRMLCCLRLPNTCPECMTVAYKFGSDNDMNCLVCEANWCWTCRKRIDQSKLGDLHFEWYNVFGCPGLQHTPNNFLTSLAAKLLVSLLFPITLLFAPLVVAMANYKPGANIVKDQALRLKGHQRTFSMHLNVAKTISLLGFSLLGLGAATIIVPVFGTLGLIY